MSTLDRSLVVLVLIGLLTACGPTQPEQPRPDGSTPGPDAAPLTCTANPGRDICLGTVSVTCDENGVESYRRDCASLSLQCLPDQGCVVCTPGQKRCQDNTITMCRADYMGWETVGACDPMNGDACVEGGCVNQCLQAAENHSNVGCDYWAVDMANIDDGGSNQNAACFAVIVSNSQSGGAAVVTVEDVDGTVVDFPGYGTQRTVAPGTAEVFVITGLSGMCSQTPARANTNTMLSGKQPGTVFRVRSTLPVVAYQVNPYEAANLHTTDASLLIPIAALGSQYMVLTYAGLSISPSSFNVVAVNDNTVVTITPRANTQAGGDVPGGSGQFTATLNRGENLQVVAEGAADLTGTTVTSGAPDVPMPIAVFAGAGCANIPPSMGYCDHLEEQMPGLRALGWTYIGAPSPQRASEKSLWRVMAPLDGTVVYIEPSWLWNGGSRVLNANEPYEFDTEYPFLLSTDEEHPVMLMNYLKGAEQTAADSGTTIDQLGNQRGDPAITLSVPVEQYMNEYVFVADPTYAHNYVVVVRTDPNAPVHLDCYDPIPEIRFAAVSGDYQIATVILENEGGAADGTCTSGTRRIWSTKPFGIWVYGYFADTSYGYPGGMSLEDVNDIIIVD
jgi:hypothetical protein